MFTLHVDEVTIPTKWRLVVFKCILLFYIRIVKNINNVIGINKLSVFTNELCSMIPSIRYDYIDCPSKLIRFTRFF